MRNPDCCWSYPFRWRNLLFHLRFNVKQCRGLKSPLQTVPVRIYRFMVFCHSHCVSLSLSLTKPSLNFTGTPVSTHRLLIALSTCRMNMEFFLVTFSMVGFFLRFWPHWVSTMNFDIDSDWRRRENNGHLNGLIMQIRCRQHRAMARSVKWFDFSRFFFVCRNFSQRIFWILDEINQFVAGKFLLSKIRGKDPPRWTWQSVRFSDWSRRCLASTPI